MRTCEACGRDFRRPRRRGGAQTCAFCGYDTNPRGRLPRSKAALKGLEEQQRTEQELEAELCDYLDVAAN